jgi:enediyne biosynthesis protein E4
VADFNNDGWPDVYVANDGTPNHLWMNQRDGSFTETALAAGAAYDDQGRAQAGMGVSAADYDNDGDEDLIVANLMGETLALYENDGHAEFRHVTVERRLSRPSMPFTGFGAGWADFDHDGLLDLFIANGSVKILDELGSHPYPYGQRSQLFHNRGGYFDEIRSPALDMVAAARGAAFGDLDRDGDIDIVINNSNGPPRLLINERAPAGQSLTIDAEGARVGVFRRGARPLWRRSTRSGSYLSSNDPAIHFGLGPQAVLEGIVIEWPDGSRQEVKPPALPRPNRLSFVNPRRRPGN